MNNIIKTLIAIVAIIFIGYAIYGTERVVPENMNDGRVMSPSYVTLAIGETSGAMGLSIRLDEVTNDYRCPVDVQCIEAGAINTRITLSNGDTTEEVFYSSDGVPMTWNGYNISIVAASPDLYSTSTINQDDYAVTFYVESAHTDIVDNPDYTGGPAGGTVPVGENPCTILGGTWDNINSECLGVDANMCQEIGGTWNECASACRNDPTAEVCTMQCVQVCEFK